MEINYTNLRRDGEVLVPAQNPKVDTEFAGWTPIARLGSDLLAYKGSKVALGTTANTIDLGAALLCAAPTADGSFIVMTADGAVTLDTDGGALRYENLHLDYPAVGMRAVSANPQSVEVRARKLSATYGSGALSKSDEKAMVGDLVAAYRRLCSLAATTGSALQPAIARYRLVDNEEHTLFISQPTLLSAKSGTQFDEYVALYSADGQTVSSYTLTAQTWKLSLLLPADSVAQKQVARLDVMLSPLFHPFDESLQSPVEYGRYSSADDVFVRVALPGRQRGLGSSFAGNARQLVRESVARLDELESCIASIHDPFAEERELTLDIPASPDPEVDAKKIASIIAKRVETASRQSVLLASPHHFVAERVAAAPSVLLWSGITVLPFRGYMPQAFAAGTTTDAAWTATVAVRFRDGSGVLRTCSGSTGAFAELTPLLCYPSPDAVKIAVQVVSVGIIRRAAFDLTPDSSGRNALYISPNLENIMLPVVATAQTFNFGEASLSFSALMAFASIGAPTVLRLFAEAPGMLTASAACQSADQSWEFGRSRFIVATSTSLLSIGVAAGFKAVSVRRIFSAGLQRADALCPDGCGGFFAAPGSLVHISTTGRLATIDDSESYAALAFDGKRSELWTLLADGRVLVFEGGSADFVALRSAVSLRGFVQLGNEAIGLSDDGILRFGNETVDLAVDVMMRRTMVPARYALRKLHFVRVDTQTSDFDGTIVIEGVNIGTARPWLIRSCILKGAVAGSLHIPFLARPLRAFRLTLAGTASPDFRVAPEVEYK